MTKVRVSMGNKITFPKDIIELLNMDDTKRVCIVMLDSETFLIKKQFDIRDIKSSFIDIRPVCRKGRRGNMWYRYITIPFDLMRKMPSIKVGGYVYVYINENKDIVVTTIQPIDFSKNKKTSKRKGRDNIGNS